MDTTTQGETISDIQNYLDNFPKDIKTLSSSESEATISTETMTVSKPVAGNTYFNFIDQSGQYIIQQADGQTHPMVVVQGEEAAAEDHKCSTIVVQQPVTTKIEPEDEEAGAVTEKEELMEDASGNTLQVISADQMQVVLGNEYQTYFLPTASANGEIGYMFVLPQAGETSEVPGQDLTVYDFTEEGQQVEVEPDQEQNAKFSKSINKKPRPAVSQQHMCQYCNYTSTKRYLLSRHMRTHSEERPHKCSVCERGFKTMASLQNHVNTHTGTKPHGCKFCDACFTTSGELVRHVRYRHTHEKPHRCNECDYSSVELSKLKRHMRCHTGERPYQCPHCTYASPDTFKLKRHLRIHTGEKPYECRICHARFTQSNSLKAHTLIHTGKKPVFQCELCPTTCGRKIDLRIHVQKLHTSDKPLKCKRCGKSFPDRYSYKCHNKTHEGEKCFKCELCPYASISQRHLESHMLIHTDQKPFHCTECEQSFRQKQLLKRHRNLYHNPGYVPPQPKEKTHQCPECGKAFRHKGNVIRHLASHDPKSNLQERSLALKVGRQRRIQLVHRQASDDPLGDDNVMSVQGQDGRQYVVLEVIHLQDQDGQQTVGLLPDLTNNDPGSGTDGEYGTSIDHLGVIENIASVEDDEASDLDEGDLEDDGTVDEPEGTPSGTSGISLQKRLEETHKDVQNCFGFDEDEDDSHSDILSDM